MKYEFLEHTADAKFRAYGKSLEEAFANAAEAMFSIMANPKEVEAKIRKKIEAEGDDRKSLLYDFLEKLIVMLDEGFILNKIADIKINGNKLKAEAVGDKISERYDVHGEVKAVTYNDMEIKEEKGKAMVQVVVDL